MLKCQPSLVGVLNSYPVSALLAHVTFEENTYNPFQECTLDIFNLKGNKHGLNSIYAKRGKIFWKFSSLRWNFIPIPFLLQLTNTRPHLSSGRQGPFLVCLIPGLARSRYSVNVWRERISLKIHTVFGGRNLGLIQSSFISRAPRRHQKNKALKLMKKFISINRLKMPLPHC